MQTSETRFFLFAPACWLQVTGEDAFSFLQGQFTNELRGEPQAVKYGLWLNQKGKVLADSFVLRQAENEFWILSEGSPAEGIRARLEQYIIADDVALADELQNVQMLRIWGTGAEKLVRDVAASTPAAGNFMKVGSAWIFSDRRVGEENFVIVGSEDGLSAWRRHLGNVEATAATREQWEHVRIRAGIPAVPTDIGSTDLPNEAGLESSAISFTKGCYLGQEVMARLKNLGQVRRQLRIVHGQGAPPAKGTLLFQQERKAGEMRSAVATAEGFLGFAMLTRMGLDENTGFSLTPDQAAEKEIQLWKV